MANVIEIGKINEAVTTSNFEDGDEKVKEDGITKPSNRESQGNCANENTNAYCRFIESHTKLAFVLVFGAHVLMMVLTAVLTVSGYDVMKFEFGQLPLDLPEDSTKLRTDAWWFAKDDVSISPKRSNQLPRSVQYQTIAMVYELENGNILTKDNLHDIQHSEEEVFRNKNYQHKLCQLQQESVNRTCKKPLSIIRFFDGSYRNIHADLYDPNFENISLVLYTAQSINASKAILNFHLGKNAIIEKKSAKSQYTRSLLYIGWPLEGFSNTNDEEEKQTEKLNQLIVDAFSSILRRKHEDGVGNIAFYYNNNALRRNALQSQIIFDLMLAIASLTFIFIFSWFHTGSIWLTAWGIFSIVSSFNITILIYRIVFDYRYFGTFHVLSIFIILGIGCDDIFIFMDTWKLSRNEKFNNLVHRLSKVYKTAAKTTFITSFTTMVAFLSNMQSPLLAIYSFGLFSAILIMVNYFSIILFFPVILILHHKSRKGKCCCARTRTKKANITTSKNISQYIVQFFEGWFFRNVITHKLFRWVVVVSFTALAVVNVFYATKLKANNEQIKVWRSDTNWNKVGNIVSNAFRKSQEDRVIIVHIIWGLEEQDRDECHHTDFKCKGKTVLDLEFDLNLNHCQHAVLKLCETMKNVPKDRERRLHLRRSQVTGDIEMECIFQRMEEFFMEESNKTIYTTPVKFPFDEGNISTLITSNPDIYKNHSAQNITRFFEVGAGFFMVQGGKKDYISSFDYRRYKDLIEGVIYPRSFSNISKGTFLEDRLLFVAIALNTTVDPSQLSYEEGLKIYDEWETFVNQKMNELPSSCNKGFQATVKPFNVWQWLKVQKLLVNNAITGIIISLVCSLFLLTIATTNVIIGLMATLTIAMVTCGVLGMISIVGWSLGILESLNLTLIVGLAIDYVVHLAEGYMILDDQDRVTRAKYTLGHVGISVFSGACTTLGSAVFMLAAKILFFSQFGIFIFCTIALSVIYALFFFTTVLAMIGPEGNTGSLKPFMRRIKNLICCKEQSVMDTNGHQRDGFPNKHLGNDAVVISKF